LQKTKFRSFEDARKFVHSLGLKSANDWREYCKSGKILKNIPKEPHLHYRKQGWISWGDWLGTGVIANRLRKYLSFEDSRKFARSLELKSQSDWYRFSKSDKLPKNIPVGVHNYYKNKGWIDWGDFLGTKTIATQQRKYKNYFEAREFVRSLGLKSQSDWKKYCHSKKLPADIPGGAHNVYKKEWKGFGDWLGTGRIATFNRKYLTFEESKKFVHSLKLQSMKEWQEFCKSGKKPNYIPTMAARTYKKEWKGNGDWLGTGRVSTQNRIYRPFPEAKKFIKSLGLKTSMEWRRYVKSGNKPDDIPAEPWLVYSKDSILRRKKLEKEI